MNYLSTCQDCQVKNSEKTKVINKVYRGPTHGEMDEHTLVTVINEITKVLK